MRETFLLLVVSLFLLTGCSEKRKQEKLIGSWDVVFLSAADTGKNVIWTFAEGGSLYVTRRADTVIVDSATYIMDSKLADAYYVTVDGVGYWEDGKYRIDKLNKKILIMERVMLLDGQENGSYLHKEFVKLEQ